MKKLGLFLGFILGTSNTIAASTNIDSINMSQSGVGRNQTVIINTDAYGNTQMMTIGGNNVQILKPMPCVKVKPTRRMNCQGKDLSGVQWNGLDVANGQFDQANLSNASLVGTNLTNGRFGQTNLTKANMEHAILVNTDFHQAQMPKANLKRAIITNGDFFGTNLTHVNLMQTELTNASFDNSDLSYATLQGARTVNVSFDGARMIYTIWMDGNQCNAQNPCPKDDFFW